MRDAFGVELSKGRYSDDIVRVQEHRQKANRRRKAGKTIVIGSSLAGTAALINPMRAEALGTAAGHQIQRAGSKLSSRGGATSFYGPGSYTWIGPGNKQANAGRQLLKLGTKVRTNPKAAVAGTIAGGAAAGGGLILAGMAHNARSNKIARDYNKTKANSKIKVVPLTAKNRF